MISYAACDIWPVLERAMKVAHLLVAIAEGHAPMWLYGIAHMLTVASATNDRPRSSDNKYTDTQDWINSAQTGQNKQTTSINQQTTDISFKMSIVRQHVSWLLTIIKSPARNISRQFKMPLAKSQQRAEAVTSLMSFLDSFLFGFIRAARSFLRQAAAARTWFVGKTRREPNDAIE